MSFMSFDYAMRAADASLQMQQGMSQNIKDTNQRVSDVGKRNANSKDQLVRQKIQAEYEANSQNIAAWKAGRLHALAEERAQAASAVAVLVGGAHLLGGVIDGIMDSVTHFQNDGAAVPQMPTADQMTVGSSAVDGGMVSAFKIAAGRGPSENGAVVAFDASKGSFSAFGVNTSSGKVNSFQNLSMTEMATLVRDQTKGSSDPNDIALAGMIADGPPIMFKGVTQNQDGSFQLPENLKTALFDQDKGFFATDRGELAIEGALQTAQEISPAYQKTADSVMSLLGTTKVQEGLGINAATVNKTGTSFSQAGLQANTFMSGAKTIFSKCIFKPLSTSLKPFMELAQVAKQYQEEAQQKKAEFDAARKQAAAAAKRLLEIEAQLNAGI